MNNLSAIEQMSKEQLIAFAADLAKRLLAHDGLLKKPSTSRR